MSQLDIVLYCRASAALIGLIFSSFMLWRYLHSRRVIYAVGARGSKKLLHSSIRLECARLVVQLLWLSLTGYIMAMPVLHAGPPYTPVLYGSLLALMIQLVTLHGAIQSSTERWDLIENVLPRTRTETSKHA